MRTKNTFKPGDLVRRKNDVYDEGVVLTYAEHVIPMTSHQYYVVFCRGTDYESKPYIELLHERDLSLIREEIHKPGPLPKFKK